MEIAAMTSRSRLSRHKHLTRQKRAKQDFLVEKESQNERLAEVNEQAEHEKLDPDGLHGVDLEVALLNASDRGFDFFLENVATPCLLQRVQAGYRHIYVALEGIYDLVQVARNLPQRRKRRILTSLGGSINVKKKETPETFQKELLGLLFAVSSVNSIGLKGRKKAQNLVSTYGRSLDGARLECIRPGHLAEAFRNRGGIEAFAEIARAENRQKKLLADVAAGIKPVPEEKLRNKGGRAKRTDPRKFGPGPHRRPKAVPLRTFNTTETAGSTVVEIDAAVAEKFGGATGKVICLLDKGQIPYVICSIWKPPPVSSSSNIRKMGRKIYDELCPEDDDDDDVDDVSTPSDDEEDL